MNKILRRILRLKREQNYDADTILRLWSKTIIDNKTGCWLINSVDDDGYAFAWYKNKSTKAHRVSAIIFLDFHENSKQQVNHKLNCPNKNCWNPDHLYVGTHSKNMYDSVEIETHRNSQKTHCPCGREYDKIIIYKNKILRRCSFCIRKRDRERYRRKRNSRVT